MLRQILFTLLIFLHIPNIAFGQEFPHPRVYITDGEKEDFMQSLEATVWKKKYVDQKKEKVERFLRFLAR